MTFYVIYEFPLQGFAEYTLYILHRYTTYVTKLYILNMKGQNTGHFGICATSVFITAKVIQIISR